MARPGAEAPASAARCARPASSRRPASTRSTTTSTGSRTTTRARAGSPRARRARAAGRPRAGRDELRPDRRRAARPHARRGDRAAAAGGRRLSATVRPGVCAPSRTSTSTTTTSSARSTRSRARSEPLPAPETRRRLARGSCDARRPSGACRRSPRAVVRGRGVWATRSASPTSRRGEAATPDHQYRVGSITKTFTAVGSCSSATRARSISTIRSTARRRGAHARPSAGAFAPSGIQRETRGTLGDARVPTSRRSCSHARRGRARARAGRALALLEPRLRAARRGRRPCSAGSPTSTTSRSGCSGRSASTGRPSRRAAPPPPATSVDPYGTSPQREPVLGGAWALAAAASCGRRSPTSAAGARSSLDPTRRAPAGRPRMTRLQTMADLTTGRSAGARAHAVPRGRPRLRRPLGRSCRVSSPTARPPRPESAPAVSSNSVRRPDRRSRSTCCARRHGASPEPAGMEAGRAPPAELARCSAAGGRRARSSSSAGTTAGSRRAGGAAVCTGAVSSAFDGDRYRTVSGRERASCSARARRRRGHAPVLGELPVQPRAPR